MARNWRAALGAGLLAGALAVLGAAGTATGAPVRPTVRVPGDSVESAFEGLAAARARVDVLTASTARLEMVIASERETARRKEAARVAEQRRRVGRAVARYRTAGELVPVLTPHTRRLAAVRSEVLFSRGDRTSRSRISRLAAEAAFASASAASHEAELIAARTALLVAIETRDTLADKLANAGGAIVSVRVPAGISASGTPIARRADAAAQRLRSASGDTWNADASWLEARHALTLELGGRAGGSREATATAIELEWDATPRAAIVATLAALRQVGKPYVYATAGPSTFDCSGLTKRAYAEAGLGLPHFSASQLHLGAPVRVAETRAGDLLAYGPDGAEHVAMYVGVGLAVEARSSVNGVVVDAARRSGSFAGATRIVP